LKTPVVVGLVGILILARMRALGGVFRRVVLARASKDPSGYGANHSVVDDLLGRAKASGWTKAATVEADGSTRASQRAIAEAIAEYGADLVHITNQHDAHLVPSKGKSAPFVVSVHDLYDHRPRAIDAGDVPVPLGDRYPPSAKARLLASCREGMARADMLLCSSERTMEEAREMFPGTRCMLVRDSIDDEFWDPNRNPRPRSMLGDSSDEEKCLIVSVGEKDPRWRAQFVSEVIALVPEEVREDLLLFRIGAGRIDWEQVAAAFQHAEAVLYPGVSVGFRSPPLEALASGCPVLASDLPMHDEVLPPRCLLPATDSDHWVSAIVEMHAEWVRAGGVPRHVDEGLLALAKESFGRSAHGDSLAKAYDMACGS
jgi:glycosyltransferase involved in cell wall biosynthesis